MVVDVKNDIINKGSMTRELQEDIVLHMQLLNL